MAYFLTTVPACKDFFAIDDESKRNGISRDYVSLSKMTLGVREFAIAIEPACRTPSMLEEPHATR